MRRLLLFIVLLSGLASCKKDRLHWQTVTPVSANTTHRLNRILFINDTLGFIAGGDRFSAADILVTHDGGRSFAYHTYPEAGKALYDITYAGNGRLYAIGFDGKLLSSSDLGQSWQARQLDYEPYKSIAVNGAGHILTIGGISFDQGFMYRLSPSGDLLTRDSISYELNQIRMLPGGTGYRCGYGTMGKTTDDGATWQLQSLRRDNFMSMDLHSAQDIWACGYNGSIYHTTNGGGDWTLLRNGNDLALPRYHLQDILFTDDRNGYAVGENGIVICSDDGGRHWMELDAFTDQTLHSIARCPDGTLLVCGESGVIFRLTR